MITSNEDFAKTMMLLANPSKRFIPSASYDIDGDCIEFIYKPDPFYAERIDDLVTVYYCQETNEVIGSLIKGVSKFCKEMLSRYPGFKIEIQHGPVKLQHIFLARLWSSAVEPSEFVALTYRRLAEASRETVVEGELCLR